jgi:hypothetical protein
MGYFAYNERKIAANRTFNITYQSLIFQHVVIIIDKSKKVKNNFKFSMLFCHKLQINLT